LHSVWDPRRAHRFGLLDALITLLVTAARTRLIVVVLDDLHWASPPSLVAVVHLGTISADRSAR
jgi:predicted ATPase